MNTEPGHECHCEEALEHLYEYIDAEMTELELDRLRAHISECTTCLEAVSREQEVRVILRKSCVEVAPDELRMRVRTQLTLLRESRRG
ncbi:mycothiol system anti-sigma-R factor [Ruania halotolerans]|uniref:mycothiol system anti-sigma-R factor n=1 Tax=Ruania halotolerans TaxID=2897773 RepID=UPI001E3D3468|nr:mycothiol system anti-sigma-R factor [Ruania halotolerans]UFU07627.1 mycothiol system anti-sigma-R factor [Ruania halotolerans]